MINHLYFSGVELPDFSKPPPGFPATNPDELVPGVPYYDLPAGLMVPLIKVKENSTKKPEPVPSINTNTFDTEPLAQKFLRKFPILAELVKNPNVLSYFTNNQEVYLKLLSHPTLASFVTNPQIMSYFNSKTDMFTKLITNSELILHIANNPTLMSLILANPPILANIIDNPSLATTLTSPIDPLTSTSTISSLLKQLTSNSISPNINITNSSTPPLTNTSAISLLLKQFLASNAISPPINSINSTNQLLSQLINHLTVSSLFNGSLSNLETLKSNTEIIQNIDTTEQNKKKRRSNCRKEYKGLVMNEVDDESKKEKEIQVSPKKISLTFPKFGKRIKPTKTVNKIERESNQDETNKSENKISSTESLKETPPVVTIIKGPVSSTTDDNPETITYQPQCQPNYNYDQYQNPYYNHQYPPPYPYPYQQYSYPSFQNHPYDIQAYYSYYYNLHASALAAQNSIVPVVGVAPLGILPTTPVVTLPTTPAETLPSTPAETQPSTPAETLLSTVPNETVVPEQMTEQTEELPANSEEEPTQEIEEYDPLPVETIQTQYPDFVLVEYPDDVKKGLVKLPPKPYQEYVEFKEQAPSSNYPNEPFVPINPEFEEENSYSTETNKNEELQPENNLIKKNKEKDQNTYKDILRSPLSNDNVQSNKFKSSSYCSSLHSNDSDILSKKSPLSERVKSFLSKYENYLSKKYTSIPNENGNDYADKHNKEHHYKQENWKKYYEYKNCLESTEKYPRTQSRYYNKYDSTQYEDKRQAKENDESFSTYPNNKFEPIHSHSYESITNEEPELPYPFNQFKPVKSRDAKRPALSENSNGSEYMYVDNYNNSEVDDSMDKYGYYKSNFNFDTVFESSDNQQNYDTKEMMHGESPFYKDDFSDNFSFD